MGEMSEYYSTPFVADDFKPPASTTAPMWETQDRQRIPIAEMEDRHLRNTIRFLRRRSDALVIRYLKSTAAFRSNMGEGAMDAFTQEALAAADGTDHDRCMFAYNKYRALYAEAEKRWSDEVEAYLSNTVEQDK